MKNWPVPRDLKALRGFLGLTGYYRRFVKDYSKISWPLTQLLKKDSFQWGMEAHMAFDKLKEVMVSVPVLTLPDFDKEFIIETDASGLGLGAVLMQEGKPVAFLSQKLSPRAQQKSVYERELMAIAMAVQKWKHYLLGRKFTIHTDQKSLKFLVDQRMAGEAQQKWIAKLLGFDFEIKYKLGRENKVADALSRRVYLEAISAVTFQDWTGLEDEIHRDNKLRGILQNLIGEKAVPAGYELKQGRLLYHDRLVIPKESPRIPLILEEFHNSTLGGHSGFFRTFKRISSIFWWEGMKRSIQQHIQACDTCNRNKYQSLSPGGLLQPLPIPSQVWEDLSMDFIEGLPRHQGLDTILVVVDRFTKYSHFIALAHPFSAKDIAEIFIKDVVKLHGFPSSIVTDRDKIFMSTFWMELFKLSGTKLKFSTAYHPQTDGQTEVINRCLETYLRCFAGTKPKQWSRWLAWAELWFNTTYSSATNTTPFRALYGRDPPTLIRGEISPSPVEEVNHMLAERNLILDELKWQLNKAQDRMRGQANKKRREVEFQVGDRVYLKLQPYRMKSLATRVNQKLSPRYYGPFEVLARVGKVAYKLQLPQESKIHPVFHVSLLKKCITQQVQCQPLPKGLTEGWELKLQPSEVLAVKESPQGIKEVLIKWDGMPDFESTWELAEDIKLSFPEFHLEDKVVVKEGGIVRDRFPEGLQVYKRRKFRGKMGIGSESN